MDYSSYDREAWRENYPYPLYLELGRNKEFPFCTIEFRRICDRQLNGDIILVNINKSYSYNYVLNPDKSWDYHHYQEHWYWAGLHFEFEEDSLFIKLKYPQFSTKLPEGNCKSEHDPSTNPHIKDLHRIS